VQAPDGYILEKRIVETRERCVALGRRQVDDRAVVLKSYAADANAAPGEARVERENQILYALAAKGVAPSPLALERGEGAPVLVMDFVSGQLVLGPVSAHEFLVIALQAARALAGVHAERLVHRAVRPANLLFDRSTQKLNLIGFGCAAPLGAPVGSATLGIDACFYGSPEQSARLERGVDYRSDLYSLGATFYDLLTGRPPFDARDPSDLIQAHIVRRARPPGELIPELSSTLSRITMKLLEKEPEDRYQTAEALHVDLETCLEQLERTGEIDDELPLAAADAPYRPLFRKRVYGRAEHVGILVAAYRGAARGRRELVLVSGCPGVGKSSLVPELHRPLATEGGFLARGKCDLYRSHLPYAALANALRDLVHQILAESGSRREAWRLGVTAELGNLAGVAAGLLPELEEVLGPSPAAAPLDPSATQARLAVTVRRLVRASARQASPLVLFLDDLQWADSGTLYLVEELLSEGDPIPLLVVGSYRENEVPVGHPLVAVVERLKSLGRSVTDLHLDVLSDEAVASMLADALARSPDEVAELACAVSRKSGKNPLLIQQCAYHLQEIGCIEYTRGQGWTWDLEAVERAVIPDDPAGMMLTRLKRLHGNVRSVVQLASCVGDEFDWGMLSELSGESAAQLQAALYELSDEGLIAPCAAGFRFVHDRIREAAQALLPDEHRRALHHRIGLLLMQRSTPGERTERCFEIADHLARAKDHLTESERLEAASWQSSAAKEALASGALGTGAHYLSSGREMLGREGWSTRPLLAFEIYFRSAACAYAQRDFGAALELLSGLREHCVSLLQRGLVESLRITVCHSAKSRAEALDLLFDSLQRLGVPTVREPSWIRTRWALLRLEWKLRRPAERWPLREAESAQRNERRVAEGLIRTAGIRPQTATSARLGCMSALELLDLSLAQGYLVTPAALIAMLATTRRAFLGNVKGVERYLGAATLWLERAPDPQANTEFILKALVLPWVAPRRRSIGPLAALADSLEETGQVSVATSALVIRANYAGLSGVPLAEVCASFDAIRERDGMTPVETPRALVRPYRWCMGTGEETPDVGAAIELIERHPDSAYYLAPHWMQAFVARGCFGEAWHVSELVRSTIFECQSLSTHVMDYVLYRGLAALVLCADAKRATPSRVLRRAARRCARQLSHAARYGPDFEHMAEWLRAERLRTRGRSAAALVCYRCAAERADAQGFLNHVAMIADRIASLARQTGDEDEVERSEATASRLFREWGATPSL